MTSKVEVRMEIPDIHMSSLGEIWGFLSLGESAQRDMA